MDLLDGKETKEVSDSDGLQNLVAFLVPVGKKAMLKKSKEFICVSLDEERVCFALFVGPLEKRKVETQELRGGFKTNISPWEGKVETLL